MSLIFLLFLLPSALPTPLQYWLPDLQHQPLVVSELGWGVGNVTENTLPAFREGIALGATGVEVTSRLTKDGKIALIHNPTATNGRVVAWSDFDQLPNGTLELGDYLTAVGTASRGRERHGMNIMMQNNQWPLDGVLSPDYDPTCRVADVVVARVLAEKMGEQTLLSAFDYATIKRAHEVCHRNSSCAIRTAWLALSWETERKLNPFAKEMNSTQYLDQVQSAGLEAFNPENTLVDGALLREAKERGVQVFVWWMGENTTSFETPARMQQLADCGVTGFITPQVKMGITALNNKVERSGKACDLIND